MAFCPFNISRHCEQTCISTAIINDSKPKQIVNLNKWFFGVRIDVQTWYISAWVSFFRKALNSHYEYSSWILNRSVNLILAIFKVISWVRMLYEFMRSFFNKIHLILQALFYCQKYDVLQPLLSCNIKHVYSWISWMKIAGVIQLILQ